MGYSKNYDVRWQHLLLIIAGLTIIAVTNLSCAPQQDSSKKLSQSVPIDVALPSCEVMPEPTPYPSPDFNCLE